MLTVFAIPKPFRGRDATIQRNAIESWKRLHTACEVVLCGDDEGVGDVAAELELVHIPDLGRTEYGTPLVSDAFAAVARRAAHPLLCYANADMLLLSDLVRAARQVPFRDFLMTGSRWHVSQESPLDFDDPEWEAGLVERVRGLGSLEALSPSSGTDYFVFPRHLELAMPPLAVGRPAWECWLIHWFRARGMPFIDASDAVVAVHQDHGYDHVPARVGASWEGPEADANRRVVKGRVYDLVDASHAFVGGRVRPARDPQRVQRRVDRLRTRRPRLCRALATDPLRRLACRRLVDL